MINFTNLIIDFCSGNLNKKSVVVAVNQSNENELKSFQYVPTFKKLVEKAFEQIPYQKQERYENELVSKFFGQYYRYCKKPTTNKYKQSTNMRSYR